MSTPETTENKAAELDAETLRIAKITKRQLLKKQMEQEMAAADTFRRLLIWMKYKWLDLIFLNITIILTGAFLGITARAVWEIWTYIFSIRI